jgi:hypothetical protein
VNNSSYIPLGAIASPPDSAQNSSDEDDASEHVNKRRGRHLENLKELKEAISVLPQRREPSPDNSAKRTSSEVQINARKYGHNRSTSDSSFLKGFDKSNVESDNEDDGYRIAPPMVRKKSGELVKSSLKTPNRSRASSVPSTPTFPKAVHFDSHLEHVRHFNNTEKPTAVSAGSSPVESFDGETEFPFDGDDYMSPPFEWEIETPNFPKDLNTRKHLPVRLERVYLSTDKQNLLGTVAVANLSFQKKVVVRFTLDFWQTVSEVTAEFNNDIRRKQREENVDRFTFKVKLHEMANLESKQLFFCIRYCVNNQELWDNNEGINYQVDFKKKFLPQNGKNGAVRMALPRSRPVVSTQQQRQSSTVDTYNYEDDLKALTIQVDKPVPKSSVMISEGAEPVRRANPSGNALSNRYDFTASLTAAMSAATTSSPKPEDGYFAYSSPESVPMKSSPEPAAPLLVNKPHFAPEPVAPSSPPQTASKVSTGPTDLAASGEKPSIESLSYRELLETYCFFGSAKIPSTTPHIVEETVSQETYSHERALITAYTLEGSIPGSQLPSPPRSASISPPLDVAQSPRYAPPPPNGSPPSLSGSQRSSASSSPVPFTYKYQPRRNNVGFAFDTPHATAIRG